MRNLRFLGYVGCLVLVLGCNRADTERLSKIGQLSKERAQAALADLKKDHLSPAGAPGLPSLPNDVAQRVSLRLKADKKLAELNLEVTAKEGEVELKGTVLNAGQRQRAVELATETVGVTKVKDGLKITGR